jgi:hypothetical protein
VWAHSFSYGHVFPTGFLHAMSFKEAPEDIFLFFTCLYYLTSVRGEVSEYGVNLDGALDLAGALDLGRPEDGTFKMSIDS